MKNYTNETYPAFSAQQIDCLTAIYDDYLYSVRQYEKLLQTSPKVELALAQMQDVFPNPDYIFPWHVSILKTDEQRHYDDFMNEKIQKDTGKAYITLEHINPEENRWNDLPYIFKDYKAAELSMSLPSPIERYTIIYPEKGTLKNTEFYIDGNYKAVYIGDDDAVDQPLENSINTTQMYTEIQVLVRLAEKLKKNNDIFDTSNFDQTSLSVYAEEQTKNQEHQILEIMGSFADKLQNICRDRYHVLKGRTAFKLAQREGLIHSADDFCDYVNIRNLMQHQWDTLDNLGCFHKEEADENIRIRKLRIKSYLKLCDKTLVQRMKSYIEILHQMQLLIGKINPSRIIRNTLESNTKFATRVKSIYRQDPTADISVELNYPLIDDKYKALNKNLHKIIPNLKVVDDYTRPNDTLNRLEDDYNNRSAFLAGYLYALNQVMMYCIGRGQDLSKQDAWNHVKDIGIISTQDHETWFQYGKLRNTLCHEYFDPDLRNQLREKEDDFMKDLNIIINKVHKVSPESKWVERGIYQFTHADGLIVQLDYLNNKIEFIQEPITNLQKKIKQSDKPQTNKTVQNTTHNEPYANGIEYILCGEKILELKLPNGIRINLDKQRINWNSQTHWHTNAEHFNVLQTEKSKLITDKNLRVTEYNEKNRNIRFRKGDNLLIDYRHSVLLDSAGRIKEFKFKNEKSIALRNEFKYVKDGCCVISLADGTSVSWSERNISIKHGNTELSYDSRQEFAATYTGSQLLSQQITPNTKSR